MRWVAFFILYFVITITVNCDDKYTGKYDNVNLEEIVKNDRLLKKYVDCLLDRGKCTNDAAELKRTIPDALETDCSKCTEKQRAGMRYMVKYLSTNKKDLWNELTEKYDPNGVYRAKYAEQISREGVQI